MALPEHRVEEAFRAAANRNVGEAKRILKDADVDELMEIATAANRLRSIAWELRDEHQRDA